MSRCWSGACHAAQITAVLQALVDAGRGDVPLIQRRFRCGNCGGRLTDRMVTSRDSARVQPW